MGATAVQASLNAMVFCVYILQMKRVQLPPSVGRSPRVDGDKAPDILKTDPICPLPAMAP